MVEIIKVIESVSRKKDAKESILCSVETYNEAIKKVNELNSKNSNWRITYKTGFVIYK